MMLDYLLIALAWLMNNTIGGLVRSFGDPVSLPESFVGAISKFQENLYLINSFLPILEIYYILNIMGLALLIWGGFKLTMWVMELLRIGKSYNE